MTSDNGHSNAAFRAAIDEVVHELDSIKSAADQALACLGEIRNPELYDEPMSEAAAISLAWDDAATITATIHEVISGLRTVRKLLFTPNPGVTVPPRTAREEAEIDAAWRGTPLTMSSRIGRRLRRV